MSKLDEMRDLRGGTIYEAAHVAPTTARTWSLQLGTSRPGGHPRYDAADAVALMVMRQLTTELGMAAGLASMIVNALRPALPELIEAIVDQQEAAKRWHWDGGPFAIVRRRPTVSHETPVETWLTIIPGDDPGPAIADQGSGMSPLVIPLRRLINKTILRLQVAMGDERVADAED